MQRSDTDPSAARRQVLAAAGVVTLTGLAAGCKIEKETAASPSSTATGAAGGAAKKGATALAKTSDIPVGGGKIFDDAKVVVTQPSAGQFKAYSVTCPHRGCHVNEISSGKIKCPCHGSQFSVTDGSVVSGPAERSLAGAQITVQGDEIHLGS